MNRYLSSKLSNNEIKNVVSLFNLFITSIDNVFENYKILYRDDELKYLQEIQSKIYDILSHIQNHNDYDEIMNKIKEGLALESILKAYIFRCWEHEINEGARLISWFKSDKIGKMPIFISCTLLPGDVKEYNTFCQSRYGIAYDLCLEGFLGACSKDAATILVNESLKNIFSIGESETSQIVNSYNLATPVMTPKMILSDDNNDYPSKHNEIILDSRFVKPKSVVYSNEEDLVMVHKLSELYNIPLEKIEPSMYFKN